MIFEIIFLFLIFYINVLLYYFQYLVDLKHKIIQFNFMFISFLQIRFYILFQNQHHNLIYQN